MTTTPCTQPGQSDATATCAFALRDVSFSYGKQQILHEVNAEIVSGSFTAIVGPNGCGKSTLMGLLSRNLHPGSGTIHYDSRPLAMWKQKEYARQVSFLPQASEIAFDFTVREVVAMGRFAHTGRFGSMASSDWDAVDEAIDTQGLRTLIDKPVTKLSGGEKQRVALARVRAAKTNVWLLDEPTANLDVHHALALLQSLRELADAGMTIVAVLHELGFAAQYATHAVMMQDGRVKANGGIERVLTKERIESVFQVGCRIDRAAGGTGMALSLYPLSSASSLSTSPEA